MGGGGVRGRARSATHVERGGRSKDREHAGVAVAVKRHHAADDLRVVKVPVRKERPERAVDRAGGEELPVAAARLAAREGRRDLPRRKGLLDVVHLEREEAAAVGGAPAAHGRGKDGRRTKPRVDDRVSEGPDPADLEGQLSPADHRGNAAARRRLDRRRRKGDRTRTGGSAACQEGSGVNRRHNRGGCELLGRVPHATDQGRWKFLRRCGKTTSRTPPDAVAWEVRQAPTRDGPHDNRTGR